MNYGLTDEDENALNRLGVPCFTNHQAQKTKDDEAFSQHQQGCPSPKLSIYYPNRQSRKMQPEVTGMLG